VGQNLQGVPQVQVRHEERGILGNVLRLWGRFNGGLYGLGGGHGLGGPLVGCRGNYVLGVSQGL
jgi:hypothetical protein